MGQVGHAIIDTKAGIPSPHERTPSVQFRGEALALNVDRDSCGFNPLRQSLKKGTKPDKKGGGGKMEQCHSTTYIGHFGTVVRFFRSSSAPSHCHTALPICGPLNLIVKFLRNANAPG